MSELRGQTKFVTYVDDCAYLPTEEKAVDHTYVFLSTFLGQIDTVISEMKDGKGKIFDTAEMKLRLLLKKELDILLDDSVIVEKVVFSLQIRCSQSTEAYPEMLQSIAKKYAEYLYLVYLELQQNEDENIFSAGDVFMALASTIAISL